MVVVNNRARMWMIKRIRLPEVIHYRYIMKLI